MFELLDFMAAAPQHTFQVLTKRPERMYELVTAWLNEHGNDQVPNHIHLVVSVEDQKWADQRIPWLIKLPCVRGLSVEPLLAPIPRLALSRRPLGDRRWRIRSGRATDARRLDP